MTTLRVLIVDDDADAGALLAGFAAAEGLEAIVVESGQAALDMLASARPDLILLDAVMPGLDGFETCRRIKSRPEGAHVPVIFMTGLADTEAVVAGFAAGGVDYVTKPLTLATLAARMRVHVANSRTTIGAMSVVDGARGRLFTTDVRGELLLAAPDARALLDSLGEEQALLLDALRGLASKSAGGAQCQVELAGVGYALARLGSTPAGGLLFELRRATEGLEVHLLQEFFALTPREADVLLWTSHGKSNKDISEILNISSRTVNKHLEQVFVKLGVENRAAAAAAATRVLLQR